MEKRGYPSKRNGESSSESSSESERSLRIFKSSVQTSQRLDIQLKSCNSWQELFSSDVIIRRQRLRENCELLLFNYPEDYSRKAEELLWRKVFYDVIQKLKYFRKKNDKDAELSCAYCSHLLSAMTFYFHLLVGLQNVSDVSLQGYFDWIPFVSGFGQTSKKTGGKNNELWVLGTCQRTLIYLGDLARYQQEFDGNLSTERAERFYHQAIYINPDLGMPHNQLGTLFWSHRYGCRAAYYYMRCLMSGSPFEGTEGNLLRLFVENHNTLKQQQQALVAEMAESKVRLTATSRFLTQFLYLQEIFYNSSTLPPEDYERLTNFILQELDMALNHTHDPMNKTIKDDGQHDNKSDRKTDEQEVNHGDLLDGRTLLEAEALLIMLITRMKIKGSSQLQDAYSFFMKFLTEVTRHCVSNMESSQAADVGIKQPGANGLVQNGFISSRNKSGHEEEDRIIKAKLLTKKLLTQRRRRRRRSTLSESEEGSYDSDEHEGFDSDLSEGELDGLLNEALSDDDNTDLSSLSGDENEEEKRKVLMNGGHTKDFVLPKSVQTRHYFLTNLVKQDLLMVLKLCLDWLRVNPEVTQCENSTGMFSQLVQLLNILPKQEELWGIAKSKDSILHDVVDEKVDGTWVQGKALREDISLLGFTPLAEIHGRLDISWNRNVKYRKLLETVVRVQSIKADAIYLASLESVCLLYDEKTSVFSVSKHSASNGDAQGAKALDKEDVQRRAKLMKTMAKQRLQSEVADLESKVKSQSVSPSPYLIPDAPTLCTQLHVLRQLVNTKKFVIIVPNQVIQALDDLKKFNPGAREAIKYLEQEMKKGNRWIRAQKEGESISPSQKRAKQEEVSVWRFHQVVYCCLYFTEQSGPGLVTLLTDDGDMDSLKKRPGRGNAAIAVGTKASPQALDLALKSNVNVQSIKSFRAQWVGKNSVT